MFKKFEGLPLNKIEKYSSKQGSNLQIDSYNGKNKVKCQLIDKLTLKIKFEGDSIKELAKISGYCSSQIHRIYNNPNHKK